MSDSAAAGRGAARLSRLSAASPAAPGGAGPRAWLRSLAPTWSEPAAIRALRATVVIPGLFAVCLEVIGEPQMTLFAVFGGFASLVLAAFGGTRRDKAVAYLGLSVAGSLAVIIGTLVSGTTWLAAVVTIPVAFAIFFAGVTGPNTASGVTPALLAYILPVATASPASAIGFRLAGWNLAVLAGAAAVLLVSPRSPGDKLRACAARSARALGRQLTGAVDGTATPADAEAASEAKRALLSAFASAPLRPTGLAAADQGLANVVELLEWCAALVSDTIGGHGDLSRAAGQDIELLSAAVEILMAAADLLDRGGPIPALDRLDRARTASAARQRTLSGSAEEIRESAAHAAHAQVIAVAARTVLADAIIAARRGDPELIAAARRRWYGQQDTAQPARHRWHGPQDGTAPARLPALTSDARYLARHASIRSVWFRNSLRGAIALAAAVAVADVSGVQHGFWVAFGTLSVLRTNAAATGATALRALAGTVIGFAVGAGFLAAIGTGSTALWIALPVAILVAAYAPGTAPFAVGQAAFTVTIVVVFNLLVPVGWRVGLLRIEDVGIGCLVAAVVGILFWPRGASGIVATDLADAFRRGAAYLSQAVDWALGLRAAPPDTAMAAVSAGNRLDEALRAYLTEQGTKRASRHDLWGLVLGSTRLRLTAYSVASLHDGHDGYHGAPGSPAGLADQADRARFQNLASELTGFYQQVASQLDGPAPRPGHWAVHPVPVPVAAGPGLPVGVACAATTPDEYAPDLLWVGEYLYHLTGHTPGVSEPAAAIATLRQRPWWR
jgi:uncharacterized membrane protein YccC